MTESVARAIPSVGQGSSQEAGYSYGCRYVAQHAYASSRRDIARVYQMRVSMAGYTLDQLETWSWLARDGERHAQRGDPLAIPTKQYSRRRVTDAY